MISMRQMTMVTATASGVLELAEHCTIYKQRLDLSFVLIVP